ncbi:MAG: heparinase II/III family protein [Verrucomicrobiota bacterium]
MKSLEDSTQVGFITATMADRARRNAQTDPWCADAARCLIEKAAPWHTRSDTELWELMFGPTMTRARVVDADGCCPVCKVATPMYTWQLDAIQMPWKVACPHCAEQFPKNDFQAYYRSGLDVHGVFDPKLPDRRLLVNREHPDPTDPLHQFGVDDGEGYCDGQHRWRFVGTAMLCGLWRQAVLAGMEALSTAYVLTGDGSYAHQAAILIDRVADLYPLFDFKIQGNYGNKPTHTNGAVDNWHDANRDMLLIAMAYDRIRPALSGDTALVTFLSQQARHYHLENSKVCWEDIRRNIEDRIFRDALFVHPERVISNYPRGEIMRAVLIEILGEPGSDKVLAEMLDVIVERATRVDGVTGEKGLPSYCAYTIAGLADYLALLSRRDPALLPALLQRHPSLRQTYRFHAETLCLQRYQPNIGDAGGFAMPVTTFGQFFSKEPSLATSQFSFMIDLYRATGDPVYVQMLHAANQEDRIPAWIGSGSLHQSQSPSTGLPYDLFAEDPVAFRRDVEQAVAQAGAEITVGSINKEQWAVAILRSGRGDRARALWLDYDMGGGHDHADGMNLGLYALGLDLMPDCGYPQIQYGGWGSTKAGWFTKTAAHNTVIVDGRDQGHYYKHPTRGRTTLWADGSVLRAMRMAFGPWPEPLPPLCTRGDQHVALYAYRVGRFRAVRVLTRANAAADWTPSFSDDFQRTELGPDWQVIEGEWKIEDGWLVGKGKLVCTRQFPGGQRLDYEAQAGCDQPCDLSAYLSCSPTGDGAFFGFGSSNNQGSKLIVRSSMTSTLESDRRIIPGQTHKVSCRCEPQHLELVIDGSRVLDCDHLPNLSLKLVFGDDQAPKRFERTAMLVDVSPVDAYVVDIFRVVGGGDHARFFHSSFGSVKTEGVSLTPGEGFGNGVLLQNIQTDPHAPVGWNATWTIEDHYRLLPAGSAVHLRHTELTRGAEAYVAEGWINAGNYNVLDEQWIPTLVTRRRGTAPLASTFVAVIEPYTQAPVISSIKRLDSPDSVVMLEITLADGRRDLIIAADAPGQILVQPEWNVKTDGELVLVRRNSKGKTQFMALTKGTFLEVGAERIGHANGKTFTEQEILP